MFLSFMPVDVLVQCSANRVPRDDAWCAAE